MKHVLIGLLLTNSFIGVSYAKTVVCDLNTIEGSRGAISQIVIDTELKDANTKDAHLDIQLQMNSSADHISETIQLSAKERFFTQKITTLNDNQIKAVTKTYLEKETFDLNIEEGLLTITRKSNAGIMTENNIIALTPRVLNKEVITYLCK